MKFEKDTYIICCINCKRTHSAYKKICSDDTSYFLWYCKANFNIYKPWLMLPIEAVKTLKKGTYYYAKFSTTTRTSQLSLCGDKWFEL